MEKNCTTCKYSGKQSYELPCLKCDEHYIQWEQSDEDLSDIDFEPEYFEES